MCMINVIKVDSASEIGFESVDGNLEALEKCVQSELDYRELEPGVSLVYSKDFRQRDDISTTAFLATKDGSLFDFINGPYFIAGKCRDGCFSSIPENLKQKYYKHAREHRFFLQSLTHEQLLQEGTDRRKVAVF